MSVGHSRARLADLKSIHQRDLDRNNGTTVTTSASTPILPLTSYASTASFTIPHSPPSLSSSSSAFLRRSHSNQTGLTYATIKFGAKDNIQQSTEGTLTSNTSILRGSLSTTSFTGIGSSGSLTSRKNYKSIGLACEIRLKEAIERSRVADRLLRSCSGDDGGVDERSSAETAVDRSISQLAVVVLETLTEARESSLTPQLHAQVMAVLEQLIWSNQTRLVTHQPNSSIAPSHTYTPQPTSSSSSLALNKSAPILPSLPILERITNYELNLLHVKNDDNWRKNFGGLSEREQALSHRVRELEKENNELRTDMVKMSEAAETQLDHQRELERIIQSLDGRLQIAQSEYEKLGQKLASLQSFSSDQQEMIIQARQEISIARQEADATRASWSHTEATDALRGKVHELEVNAVKLEEQVASTQKLYYAMMASCHNAIQKKDALSQELDAANARIAELTQTREEILRPFTPRPDWKNVYRAHICELTPTFLLDTNKPTDEQIHTILEYLLKKNSEITSLTTSIEQTLEVQNQTKKDLSKARRDLEIAIRTGMNGGARNSDGPTNRGDYQNGRAGMTTFYMKPKSTSRYFIGLGLGKEVPPFLRAQGKIRNRHLSKKDTEAVIRDVWSRKVAHDRERGRLDLNLSDWFHFYLKNKYGLPSLVAEFGYNVIDACERYRWDADCEIFLKILVGEVCEEVYYDQCLLMQTLTHLFMQLEIIRSERRAANLQSGASIHTLPMDYISRALRLLFPFKPDEAFEAVCASLAQCFLDSPKSQQDYGLLFRENRSMNETGFVEEIRDQHLYEIENFHIQLTEEIILLPREHEEDGPPVEAGDGKVRMYDIHNAWIRLDPQATVESMDRYISRALRIPAGPNGVYAPVDPTLLVHPIDFCRSLFSASLIKPTCNFDPTACAKLSSIPLPDQLPNTDENGSKSSRKDRRRTFVDPNDLQALGMLAPKKGVIAITSPKVMRLRSRFGLDGRSDEILFLERGPNFLDPTSMKMNEKEVETLMTEKASLDEARVQERIRMKENAEKSAQLIHGIGVRKREQTDKEKQLPTPIANQQQQPSSSISEEKTSTPSSSRNSLSSNTYFSSNLLSHQPSSSQSLDTVTSQTDSNADDISSLSTASPLSPSSIPPSSGSQSARTAPLTRRKSSIAADSTTAVVQSTSMFNSALTASSSATAAGSAAPLAPNTSALATLVAPKYKSSFFTPPEVHAADSIHEQPAHAAPPGTSMKSPNAAFKRRYTEKLTSSDIAFIASPGNNSSLHHSTSSKNLSKQSGNRASNTASRASLYNNPTLASSIEPSRETTPERTIRTSTQLQLKHDANDPSDGMDQESPSTEHKLVVNIVANTPTMHSRQAEQQQMAEGDQPASGDIIYLDPATLNI